MLHVYDPDPDNLQDQLTQALRSAHAHREVASGLWLALTGLRAALDASQDDEEREHLRHLGEQVQQAHQGAQYLAIEMASLVAVLTPKVTALADACLAGNVAA